MGSPDRDAILQLGLDAQMDDELSPLSHRTTLLVIDDDVATQRVARRPSLNVLTTATLERGLELAQSTTVSAVLIDFRLIQPDPKGAVRRLRAATANEELPLIFLSADGSLETRIAAATAGAMRFLDKPLSEQKFSELLLQWPFAEPQSTRVVIVDDDPIVLEKYESELRDSNYFIRGVMDPNLLVEALEDVRPDVLLLDVNLGDISGIEICRALRCSPQWQFLPILLFSGDSDPDMRVRAYQAGASDVLGKPLSAEELMARVHAQAERIQLIRERSDRDPLSGLMLRRAFVESVQRALGSCSRDHRPLSLVLFDLDHFKQINDQYGHLVGDRVISAIGTLLRKRFRIEDLRGRWGGEEFVLAFSGLDGEAAKLATERILAEFSREVFETEDSKRFSATFTAGIAVYPRDGTTLDALIKRADELLYRGKARGRACVCIESPSPVSS